MQKSDYVFVGWVVAIVIVAALTIFVPAWSGWMGWLLVGLVLSGLVALFRYCRGAEMEPE